MATISLKTASVAFAAGVLAMGLGGPVAKAAQIDTSTQYYDWTWQTVAVNGETTSGNIVLGLSYGGASNSSQYPFSYNVVSARGSVNLTGTLNETLSINTATVPTVYASDGSTLIAGASNGIVTSTLDDQVDNTLFTSKALPSNNFTFAETQYGIGISVSLPVIGVAGLDVGLAGRSTYQLLSLDTSGGAFTVSLPGTVTADNPDGVQFEQIRVGGQHLTHVPEPSALMLLATALLGIVLLRRRAQFQA